MIDFSTNSIWQINIADILENGDESSPRGQPIKEIIGNQTHFSMLDPIITIKDRKLNYSFAAAEALWIISGSNKLSGLTPYMKNYANYSDDGVFLNGAYGPKFVDQLRYVVDTLEADRDSRQAVINIWRENPRPTKDVPCTINQQFLIRGGCLHGVTTMRSQDLIWGFGYDSFTFTMCAKVIQTLLGMRGIDVDLGMMTINQGSAHIYEKHWEDVERWTQMSEPELVHVEIRNAIKDLVETKFDDYAHLLKYLESMALYFKAAGA